MMNAPSLALFRRHRDEGEGADLASIISPSDGPGSWTLTIYRLRPEAIPPSKRRTFPSIEIAQGEEEEFLSEAAHHRCSAACGEWVRS